MNEYKELERATDEEIARVAQRMLDEAGQASSRSKKRSKLMVQAEGLREFGRQTEMGPDGKRRMKPEAFAAYIEKLADEVWRAPPSRDPAICINGIPLPVAMPVAGTTEDEMRHVNYATVGDLEACLKDTARFGDMPKLDEAIQEALRRAHGDREVDISEIIDR